MRLALPLVVIGFLAACNGDDMPSADAAFACDCTDLTATDVRYDNVGSGLSGTDVQDAVDELAARPVAIDVASRITLEERTVTASSGAPEQLLTLGCPGGVGLALGGACFGGDGTVSLQGTELQAAAFTCRWLKAMGTTPELTIQVTCLVPAD